MRRESRCEDKLGHPTNSAARGSGWVLASGTCNEQLASVDRELRASERRWPLRLRAACIILLTLLSWLPLLAALHW